MAIDDLSEAMILSRGAKEDEDSSSAGWIAGLALLGVGGLVAGLALSGGGKKKPDEGDPPAEQPPQQPPPADGLSFDLENNWGQVPAEEREKLAKLELASGIPGIARIAAIKAWQAYRAGQPYLTPSEVRALYEANPDLNRIAIAEIDAADAKAGLDNAIAAGWPKPKDYDGYAAGSFGYFDILGSNIPWAGIHTDANDLPFLNLDAKEAGANLQVQYDVFAYMIWRILQAPGYTVLVPGVQAPAAQQDPLQTWSNVMSAYANPTAYMQQTDSAKAAKQAFIERALELGIDLAQVAYPWPPGKSYSKAVWKFRDVVDRLQSYSDASVSNSVKPPVVQAPPAPAPPADALVTVGTLKARVINHVVLADPAPLLVVLHGRSASEGQLLPLVTGAVKTGRIAFLRGPIGSGSAFRWFNVALGGAASAAMVADINKATSQVVAAIAALKAKYPTTTITVLGYSQGAAIAYTIAARTQQANAGAGVLRVIAAAGWIPPALRPTSSLPCAVHGIHGTADANIPIARALATVQSFILKSPDASLTEVAGGTHNLATLQAAIETRLKG